MTFYSIIFGILFVAVCRELLQTFFDRQWRKLSFASTLALLIVNDMIFTSHEMDQMQNFYTVEMKLIDLLLFVVLAMSIVLIDPENNLLGARVDLGYLHGRQEAMFWGLLSLYWVLGLVWDSLGKEYDGLLQWLVPIPMSLPFLCMFFLAFKSQPNRFTRWTHWAVPAILVVYILTFKLILYKQKEEIWKKERRAGPVALQDQLEDGPATVPAGRLGCRAEGRRPLETPHGVSPWASLHLGGTAQRPLLLIPSPRHDDSAVPPARPRPAALDV